MKRILTFFIVLIVYASLLLHVASAQSRSGDAWIQVDPGRWTLGTDSVQRVVELLNGHLRETQHLQDESTTAGLQLGSRGFAGGIGKLGDNELVELVHGDSGNWKLVDSNVEILKQGELQLVITLQRGPLAVTKTYVLHPLSSVIREWVTYKNVSKHPLLISNPGFLDLSIQPSQPDEPVSSG